MMEKTVELIIKFVDSNSEKFKLNEIYDVNNTDIGESKCKCKCIKVTNLAKDVTVIFSVIEHMKGLIYYPFLPHDEKINPYLFKIIENLSESEFIEYVEYSINTAFLVNAQKNRTHSDKLII